LYEKTRLLLVLDGIIHLYQLLGILVSDCLYLLTEVTCWTSCVTLFQQPTAAPAQAGYATTATYGAPAAPTQQSAQQQQQVAWSQQASVQGAQQADAQQGVYGRSSTGVASVPASGGSANVAASQYGGQYGAVYAAPTQGASQQVR